MNNQRTINEKTTSWCIFEWSLQNASGPASELHQLSGGSTWLHLSGSHSFSDRCLSLGRMTGLEIGDVWMALWNCTYGYRAEKHGQGAAEREIERMGKNEVVLFLSLQWFHHLIVMYTTFDRNGKHWHYGIVSTTVSEWTTELCKIHTPHDKPIVMSGWSHAKRQIIFFASKSQYIFTVVLTLKSKMPPDLFVSAEINWRACLLWALMS